jgi:hypothetical protein
MKLLILAICFSLTGCATAPVQMREPTQVQLKTSKKDAYLSLVKTLTSKGYVISGNDEKLGLIRLAPKQFVVKRGMGGFQWPAQTSAQAIVDNGQVNITMSHECGVATSFSGAAQMQACHANDKDAAQPIKEIEQKILSDIQSAI